jgi:hypothetical protein
MSTKTKMDPVNKPKYEYPILKKAIYEDGMLTIFIYMNSIVPNEPVTMALTLPNTFTYKQLKDHIYSAAKYLIKTNGELKEVFATIDEEGKLIKEGKDTDIIKDLFKNDQAFYINYYKVDNIWKCMKAYKNMGNPICKFCNNSCANMIRLLSGWRKYNVCENCLLNPTLELTISSSEKIACLTCGNGDDCKFLICKELNLAFTKCKDKCLSPEQRQCGNCGIPVEFVDLCKNCKKCYCSEKCKEEDKHNDKCK